MSFYEKNLALIQDNPKFLQAIQGEKAIDITAGFDEDAKNFRVLYNGKKHWLCSPQLTEEEIKNMLEHIPEDAEMALLFGLGRGELLPYLSQLRPLVKKVIVIEPLQEVFQRFLHDYSITSAFKDLGQVSFIVNQPMEEAMHEVKRILHKEQYFALKWGVATQIAYKYLFPDYERNILQTLYIQRRFQRVNENTIWGLQRMWSMNFWRNFMQPSIKAELFQDVFKEKPVIIVSAGPSLQKNVHLLSQAKKKAIVIAVGSAISVLESHGIKPHARIAIDPGENNAPLFQCIDGKDQVPLFYANSFFYQTLAEYPGKKIHMCLNAGGIVAKYFQDKLDKKRIIFRSGFSVANVAYDLAAQLGSNKIIIVGQDLCYTSGRLHALGAWDQDFEEKYIQEEMEAIDFEGNVVATDSAFLGMREVYETFIKAHAKNVVCINATEGGLPIAGAPNRPLAEVLEELSVQEIPFDEQIQAICAMDSPKQRLREKKEAFRVVSEFIRKAGRLHCLYQKLLKQYQSLLELITEKQLAKSGRLQKELSDIYAQMEKQDFYHKLILPVFKNVHMRRRRELLQNPDNAQQMRVRLLLAETQEVEEFLRMNLAFAREYCGGEPVTILLEE